MSTDRLTPSDAAIADGLVGAIGGTPLIRLRRASEATGCTILGKAEFMNPGGSVKDRAALAIILNAEQRGQLRTVQRYYCGPCEWRIARRRWLYLCMVASCCEHYFCGK